MPRKKTAPVKKETKPTPKETKPKATPKETKGSTKRKIKDVSPPPSGSGSGSESGLEDDQDDDFNEVDSDDLDKETEAEEDDDESEFEEETKSNKRTKTNKTKSVSNKKQKLDDKDSSLISSIKLIKPDQSSKNIPLGMIGQSTMNFLSELSVPENNDREWLSINDQIYRLALKNWNEFVTYLVPKLIECDWTLPVLPYKDLVHRLHRDVRFSNDKTPYKTNFSVGFSRTGKKGPWASYYIHIKPGDGSLIAGGIWNPDKSQLTTIRQSILSNSKPLRKVINHPEFIKMFGSHETVKGKSKRSSIFGHDDELKNSPKMDNVNQSHPEIDLLKLKTIAAVRYFSDELVLSDRFVEEIQKSVKTLSPLIMCLNEMLMPEDLDDQEGAQEEEEEEEEE
ncbi:uncharacterized protein MELLADRAFT_115976 [Melampsora larici-populina 98AG31]|uniref:Uncharacterized protein n=1 Tax=Melampsora larici-populina (strain 98AG31 / pathotype 3-4-7) TaxID=747676 RepID=F4RGI6_MELLP|nr:uncharacterized protein MELLADRAFT_115976 [Melampsora larici-populina 98AG31]EGG08512.1 hypothetical protein MELLADRAFT_115976 [Melampsora larici-populina 98AG31]